MLVLINFCIQGKTRFLSHAETVRVLQRAFVRASIPVEYSSGHNPRPLMSLPLPRSVGIEASDEICALCTSESKESFDKQDYEKRIAAELPEGIEIKKVSCKDKKEVPKAISTIYHLPINFSKEPDEQEIIKRKIEDVLNKPAVNIERGFGPKRPKKTVNVRDFIEKVDIKTNGIDIKCVISSQGTIRPNEIIEILGLSQKRLEGRIRRTAVEWKMD